MTARALKVAPRGGVSGLFSVFDLTLVVLPKLWREDRVVVATPPRGTVVCYELDTLVFRDETPGSNGVDQVVDGLLRLNRGQSEDAGAPRLVEEVAVPRTHGKPQDGTEDRALDELLVLLELSLRVTHKLPAVPILQSCGGYAHSIDGPAETEGNAYILREILRASQLVRLVQARMGDIRRTYIPTKKRSKVVRGRIVARGLFGAEVTGELDCEFEEFSEITPLYRVVRTTLDLVISDSARWGWFRRLPFAEAIISGASGICRQLSHISAMPRAEGAKVAGQMRFGPTLRAWEPVRIQCASILAELPATDGRCAAGGDTGLGLTVYTAILWQGLVTHALNDLGPQRDQLNPEQPGRVELWMDKPFKTKVVDAALGYRGERWLIDAKYKDFPGEGAPSMEDQYQMFGYSHLYDEVAHVALIYPRSADALSAAMTEPHYRGGRARPCTIRWATAPFPSGDPGPNPEQHWERAIRGLQEALLTALDYTIQDSPFACDHSGRAESPKTGGHTIQLAKSDDLLVAVNFGNSRQPPTR